MPNPSSDHVTTWLSDILASHSQQPRPLQQLITSLVDQKATPAPTPSPAPAAYDPYGALVREIPIFSYDKDDHDTFDTWTKPYGPVVDDRGADLTDERKRNLVVDKLDSYAYKTYAENVLQQKLRDIGLETTIQNLTQLFGPKRTLISRRLEFLQYTCPPLSSSNVPYRKFGKH